MRWGRFASSFPSNRAAIQRQAGGPEQGAPRAACVGLHEATAWSKYAQAHHFEIPVALAAVQCFKAGAKVQDAAGGMGVHPSSVVKALAAASGGSDGNRAEAETDPDGRWPTREVLRKDVGNATDVDQIE